MIYTVPDFEVEDLTNESLSSIFSKEINVFGLMIYATSNVSDEDIIHAANIYAQYLDNNQDGEVDDIQIIESLIQNNATLVMFEDENEIENTNLDELDDLDLNFQDLLGDETIPNASELNEFDASLEEILHLISDIGYAEVYPHAFATSTTSLLTEAMDDARGGYFIDVPNSYPDNAWYTYDDTTCDYACHATEYFYWGLTSILGAQNYPGRYDEIKDEWLLNTAEKVQSIDYKLYSLLTNPEYSLPTVLPNGNYIVQENTIELEDIPAADLTEHSTKLQQLYIAYFGRAADPNGLNYWTNTGITSANFAANMYFQPEFNSAIDGLSTAEQINKLYNNLFGRDGGNGINYWTTQIELGLMDITSLANDLIYAAMNAKSVEEGGSAQGLIDQQTLINKTNAAVSYTETIAESQESIDAYVAGDAFTEAVTYLSTITETNTGSINGIEASIDDFADANAREEGVLESAEILLDETSLVNHGIVFFESIDSHQESLSAEYETHDDAINPFETGFDAIADADVMSV